MPKQVTWESTGLEVLHSGDFDGARLKRPGLYAICFAATWCPPTRRFVPHFVAREGKFPARLAIADISDLDDPLWDTFEIKITPSMAVFMDGAARGWVRGRRMIGLTERDLDTMAKLIGPLSAGAKPS